ncbi:MAG: GTP cyclohydrolase I FolE [Proteobacteria bacterium]|jgi:GTP cyclohydrolase I|nr:GTP cyclohydrolase I FolE [Pseudomonadota bacterium]
MNSKDYELGKKIQQLLIKSNLENPIIESNIAKWQDSGYLQELNTKFADFLQTLGLNLSNDSLMKTPDRVVKFWVNELFYGLDYKNFPRISAQKNSFNYTSPLISSGITVNSTCEHHLVSICGKAIVAYIPSNKIVGLSKINRIVDFFAKRPQVQERMIRQVFVTLQDVLETQDVAVGINAIHNCIVLRGVKDSATENLTLELGGKFLDDDVLKDNFYQASLSI